MARPAKCVSLSLSLSPALLIYGIYIFCDILPLVFVFFEPRKQREKRNGEHKFALGAFKG
jgi:hypothetical protein